MKKLYIRPAAAKLTFVATALLATSSPAWTQDLARSPPAVDISLNIGAVSDYRFRGISLSNLNPALQGGIDLTTPSGWFVGTWASSISDYGGAKSEIDVYAGYASAVAGIDLSVGGYVYLYPNGTGVNYVELQSSFGKTFGETTLEAELAYVPDQKNTTSDNIYADLTVTRPIGKSPVSVKLRGGFEDGFYDKKWDWEAGVLLEHGSLAASVTAVGSNYGGAARGGRLAKTGLLAGLTLSF